MMQVFMVFLDISGDCSFGPEMGQTDFLGCYSSKELAEKAIETHKKRFEVDGEYSIDETDVDVDGF